MTHTTPKELRRDQERVRIAPRILSATHFTVSSIGRVRPETPSLKEAAADANGGGHHVTALVPQPFRWKPRAPVPVVARVAALGFENDGKERADALGIGSAVETGALPATLNARQTA